MGKIAGTTLYLMLAITGVPACNGDDDAGGGPGNGECPAGLAGLGLVRVPSSDGSAYCIDEREVTWGEYKAFLAANPPTTGQPPECSWNTAFEAEYYDPEDSIPSQYKCNIKYDTPVDGQAVNCIDFCDAVAYCSGLASTSAGESVVQRSGDASTSRSSRPQRNRQNNSR